MLPLLKAVIRKFSFAPARRVTFKHLDFVKGLGRVPKTGPVMIVPNHRSYFDHYLVTFTISEVRTTPTWFLTKKESFERYFRRIWTEAWHGIPVDREHMQAETLRAVKSAFNNGHAVCIYPEGTRNFDAGLLPFKDGAFRLAISHGVPVLPAYIHGSANVLPVGSTSFSSAKAGITFGPILVPPQELSKSAATDWLREETKTWMEKQEATEHPSESLDTLESLHAMLDQVAMKDKEITLTKSIRFSSSVRSLLDSRRYASGRAELFARLAGLQALYGSKVLKGFALFWTALAMEDLRRKQSLTFWSQYLLGKWDSSKPFSSRNSRVQALKYLSLARRLDTNYNMRASKAIAQLYISSDNLDEAVPYLHEIASALESNEVSKERAEWAKEWIEKISHDDR